MHFYNNFRKECLRHGRFDMSPDPLLCTALWNRSGNFTCVQAIDRLEVVHGYIHGYSHGYPRKNLWIWMWIWMGNFISTASLVITNHDLLSNLISHKYVMFTKQRATFDAYAPMFYYAPIQHVAI